MNLAPFKSRRDRLLARMEGGVAVIPTASEKLRNRDTSYPFRADSYFHYLAGFPEPEAVLVLVAGGAPKSILFCRDKDPDREVWDGFRYGPEAAREMFGFDEAHSVNTLDGKLAELVADRPALWYSMGHDAAWDARVMAAVNAVRAQSRSGKRAPAAIHDVRHVVDEMRLVKDAHEIALMRRAAEISADAHVRAMRAAAPGRFEYEVEAELIHEFRRRGSQHPAYPSIVASGPNACVLHYVGNDRRMEAGELLLIDAGCEVDGYAADITRTFPVDGRFTGPQRDVYGLVLAAQKAAIAAIRPGATFHDPHDAAVRVLAQGMIDLGLLAGSLDGALESESYKRFYMHRTGHWLGLDVHDAGLYREESNADAWRKLVPGMTLTVEPGCYIRPADDVPEAFRGIGVRIEDDALVTEGGCDILTAAAPKEIAEIEAVMGEVRRA
ncbi:MAG: Xaa-Pro aminopeptidase [Candidatus Nitricoxidivorans perseverans]|uniref:Xaa-Pro aminopeptidase n=1 Tax=Candidatus Nitricoxidivorans perseverans TaxID=2975601 RepID=A0AA49IXT5_9PROT|nr:MAG: Xaa-Pro aminopeptidase [Candidatus Nitricoxidivorans perseverans]